MSNFPSSVGTTQPYIPAIPSTQLGRYAGAHMHFPILTDGAGDAIGSTSLVSAVLQERTNITNSEGIWSANQPFTVAIEPFGVERVWTIGASASLSHARKVLIRAGLVVTLTTDTNAVTAVGTSGATPTGGTAGDLAIDYAGNAYWLNVSGTWTSQGAVYAASSTTGLAPLASPAFTGTPTVPTATAGTNTTQAASTAFVESAVGTGVTGLAPLASPTFTGTPAGPTPTSTDSSTRLATTAMVQAALSTAVTGVLVYKGGLDASSNPNYPSAAAVGEAHIITVAGLIGGSSGAAVGAGDMIIASAANAGGTQSAVGASWDILRHSLVGALQVANNLSDVASAATALANLGGAAKALGPYASAAALQTAFPAGTAGRAALVGTAAPYTKYWDNGTAWVAELTDPGVTAITSGGTVAITQAAHANRVLDINSSSATTLAFSNAATGGYLAGASFFGLNVGTGTITVTGVSGGTFTVPQGGYVSVQYAAETDTCYSLVSAGAGVVPLTVTGMQVPNSAPNTIIFTMSRAVFGGALPAASTFAPIIAGSADAVTAVALTDSTHVTLTLTTAVTNGQAVTLAYTEGATRLRSLDTDTPLQSFTASTVTNNVASASFATTVANTAYPSNPYDVTTAAFNDWYTVRGGQLAFSYHKAGANLITVAAGSNLASVNGNGGAPTISWDGSDAVDNDGAQAAGNSGGNSVNFTVTNTALAADLDISVPAPNGVECELWLAGYIGDPSTVGTAIGQLSESGANVATLSVGGATGFWYARFLFKASTAGATFNAILRQGANSPSGLCFAQALYKTGVTS